MRLRTRKPDSGSDTLGSWEGVVPDIWNITGDATTSLAAPPSTVEIVTVGRLGAARSNSSRKGNFSARQIPASGLKCMLRYCSGLNLSSAEGTGLRGEI